MITYYKLDSILENKGMKKIDLQRKLGISPSTMANFSKNKYEQKVNAGKSAGRKKKVDDGEILRLAREGKSSAAIAELLGCSKSAIDHSEGWRRRKDDSITTINEKAEEVEAFSF